MTAPSTPTIDAAAFAQTLSLIPTEGIPLLVLGRKATRYTDTNHAITLAQAAVDAGTDVYFSLATVTGNAHETYGHTLRNSANLVSYGVLFAELDAGEGKPFHDRDSAKTHLQSICAAGLPAPTHIVSSGGGLHLYWKLDAPLVADEFAEILPIWKAVLTRFGLQFDAAALLPTQILRVAGTFNFKHGQVRPVEFLGIADGAYSYASLSQWMQVVCPDVPRAIPMVDREAPAQAGRFELDWLREELSKLEPDCTRDAWLAVGFGLAGETACSDEGYALWNGWSMGALTGMPVPSYSEEACWKFWSSAQDSRSTAHAWGPGVIERLFARQETEVTNARAETMARMLVTTNIATQASDIPALAGLPRPNPLGVAPITVQTTVLPEGLLEDAARGQAATKRSEAATERAVNTKAEREKQEAAALVAGLPTVLQNICYGHQSGDFYDFETGANLSEKIFNTSMQRPLLEANCIEHISPSEQARVLYKIPVHEGEIFRPAEGMIVTVAGLDGVERNYHNTFALNARRPLDTEVTPEGQAAFDILKLHVLHGLCGGDNLKARYLLSTLMWYLKHPGVRLGTLLLIAGASGIGKSILTEMVSTCFGSTHVSPIQAKDFTEGITFNSHLAGGILGVVDDLANNSAEHRKVIEKFREYITMKTISIERKGQDRKNTELTKNFIVFSNFPDLVSLPEGDRRTLYVRAPWESKEDLAAHMARVHGIENYKDRLADAVLNHPTQLLLQARMYQMPPNFGVDADPYMTEEKRVCLGAPTGASGSAITMALAQSEDIGSEDPSSYVGITQNIVSLQALTRLLRQVGSDDKLQSRIVGYDLANTHHRLTSIEGGRSPAKPAFSYGKEHHVIYYRKGTKVPSFDDVYNMFKMTKARIQRPETHP